MKFFSPDSKFAQVMTSIGEMMMLNLCWIIASIPIITIGASNIAMYTVMRRRLRKENSGTIVPFFKAWWSNIKQGIAFWLAQLLISASLGLSMFLTLPTFFKVISLIVLILVSLTFSIIYPQIARFRNNWFAYLKNALVLLIPKLGWALLNMLMFLIPVGVFLVSPPFFLRLGWVWILFGFSVLFYLSSIIMQKVLKPMEDISSRRK